MTTADSPALRATLSTPTDREIHTERVFDAPKDLVWRALTEPDLIAQWWGRGNSLIVERFELERGGHWRVVEHVGGKTHGFEGRFREVTPPDRFVRTFEWDGMPGYPLVETITLEDLGDGRTRMLTVSQFYTPEERDGMIQAGMEAGKNASYAALDRLLKHLAG